MFSPFSKCAELGLAYAALELYIYPGGGRVHDLRLDGDLPPDFQKSNLF